MKYDYRIAIPSSNRCDIIQEKTLAYLQTTNINLGLIDVHTRVDNFNEYRDSLDEETYGRLVSFDEPIGIREARNRIASFYDVGTYLVCIDDDIECINERIDSKTMKPVKDLEGLINYAFDQTRLYDYRLWGIHYCNNPFYMTKNIRVSLSTIAGGFFGYRVEHRSEEFVNIDDYEDIERTFNFYEQDGGVIRLDQYSTKTKLRTDKGGQQKHHEWQKRVDRGGMQDYRGWATCQEGASYLANRYPDYCDYKIGKDGLPTVKVRDKKEIRRRSTL